jgi:uncharacterized protein (TIGR02284 family)
MSNNEVLTVLDHLIETCRRGHRTFRMAAETVQSSEFRRLFNVFAQQRAQFVVELQAEVHRLGSETPSESGRNADNTVPFPGSAQKQPRLRDEASIVVDCQREEEAALNDYQDALKADLSLDVQYVVKRQYMDIKDAYDRIRILQRAA